MYANIVAIRYKSRQDVDLAIAKIQDLAAGSLPGLPGFQDFMLVRNGETTTTHVVRFLSEQNAATARERMLPRLRELVSPHAAGAPDVTFGPVVFSK